ncbi:MAG: NAD(P)-dependent oxidoreductase [Thermodesulfobacteriota bacterium]
MAAETVLITGGCGFLGQHLANELAGHGFRPVLFGNRERRHLLHPDLSPENCPFARGDVLNLPELEAALAEHGAAGVIHAAAVVPPDSEARPYHSIRVNLLGTLNVLEAVRRLGLGRLTMISSGAVYAAAPADAVEEAFFPPDLPYGFYGAAKASAEMIGLKYAGRYGLDFVSTRHGALYGPGGEGSPHYLYRLLLAAQAGRPVRLESGADHRFEFVHVADAARGVRLVHTAPKLGHRIYNIGAGRDYRLAEVAELIKLYFPQAELELGPGPVSDLPQRRPFDISRAREVGYEPRWSLETGLADYLASMEKSRPGEKP